MASVNQATTQCQVEQQCRLDPHSFPLHALVFVFFKQFEPAVSSECTPGVLLFESMLSKVKGQSSTLAFLE